MHTLIHIDAYIDTNFSTYQYSTNFFHLIDNVKLRFVQFVVKLKKICGYATGITTMQGRHPKISKMEKILQSPGVITGNRS